MLEEEYIQALNVFGTKLVQYLKQRAPVDTGALRDSITYGVDSDGLVISYLQYGVYQDLGVRGVVSSNKAPNSPFSFKEKRTRFGALSPVGGDLPYGARVNIRKFGLTATGWATDPFTGEPIIPQPFVDEFGEDLAAAIQSILQTTTTA
jgi:hypothetical protein